MLRENNNKMMKSLILSFRIRLFYFRYQTLKVESYPVHVAESVTRHIRVIIQFFYVVIIVNARVILDESKQLA